MAQSKALSLAEALVFVERTARDSIGGKIPPIQPAVMRVLQRDASNVPTKGIQTEVALFSVLIMTLVHFTRCNAMMLTTSDQAARSFFDKPLFTAKGPNGVDFAARCGKTLKLLTVSPELKSEAEIALSDCNTIPVTDLATIQHLDHLTQAGVPAPVVPKKSSWWARLVSRPSPPPPQSVLKQGLLKLNCVVKLSDDSVSLDSEVGVDSVLLWAVTRGIG
jgi:hypothetical protein